MRQSLWGIGSVINSDDSIRNADDVWKRIWKFEVQKLKNTQAIKLWKSHKKYFWAAPTI